MLGQGICTPSVLTGTGFQKMSVSTLPPPWEDPTLWGLPNGGCVSELIQRTSFCGMHRSVTFLSHGGTLYSIWHLSDCYSCVYVRGQWRAHSHCSEEQVLPRHCSPLRCYLRDCPARWGISPQNKAFPVSPLKITVLSVFVHTFSVSVSLSLPISSSLRLFPLLSLSLPCPAPAFCPYPQNGPDEKAAFWAPYQETTWTTGLHSGSLSILCTHCSNWRAYHDSSTQQHTVLLQYLFSPVPPLSFPPPSPNSPLFQIWFFLFFLNFYIWEKTHDTFLFLANFT